MTRWLCCLWFALFALVVNAAPKTQVRLLLPVESARPGDTVPVGVRMAMPPGWHTYWQNPGESGQATTIQWTLPPGIIPGETQWPIPEKLVESDLTTYAYKDEIIFFVPLKISEVAKAGPVEISAKLSWLECEKQCVPAKGMVNGSFTIGAENKPSADAQLLAAAQKRLPESNPSPGASAIWEKPAQGDTRPLILEWPSTATATEVDFFPLKAADFEVLPATGQLPAEPGKVRIRKLVKKSAGDWPGQIAGLLVNQSGATATPSAFDVKLTVNEPAGTTQAASQVFPPKPEKKPLVLMLWLAFLGGLILNIMPCVLPVIALKILGFVSQSREAPGRVRLLGLVYAAGVIVSFLVLAGLVIGVKAAGQQASWGMQFGNPKFLVAITVLVTLVALNLFGLFEFTLGSGLWSNTGELASREGATGAFFNGVLATVLATPCTAPFLGAALGFAFSQSAGVIALMFVTVAVGLAAPYVILSWQPAWLKFLPRPGAWMEKFKTAMGFPMLATAVWLFSLTITHYGARVLWLGIFLVLVALAAWIFGEFGQRGRTRQRVAAVIALLLLLAGYGYALEGQLRWREPIKDSGDGQPPATEPGGIQWQKWSPAAVARARAQGRPVFVDFTADWCLTCNVNRKTSIEILPVREKLKAINAVTLLGDYTRVPDDITAELQKFGRAGVPLVLVYPKDAQAPPQILPEVLTPGIVLEALEKAVK